MDGITRDFTVAKVEELIEIVKEEVEEEGQFFLFDWFEDTFITQQLDVRECLDDIKGYHSTVIDKYNIGYEKLQLILDRVATVDQSYSGKFDNSKIVALAFAQKVQSVAELLSYGGLSLTPAEMQARIDTLSSEYAVVTQYAKESNALLNQEVEVAFYEEPEWWEQVLNGIGGVGVSLVTNCLVEPVLGLMSAVEWVFSIGGTSGTSAIREAYYNTVADLEAQYVTSPQWYYGGRVVGDVASMVIGTVVAAQGLTTMLGGLKAIAKGIFIGGASAATAATGVGAGVGVIGTGISVAAVSAGAISIVNGSVVTAVGAIAISAAITNFGDNLQRFQSSGNNGFLGENGTQTSSSTTGRNGATERVDVENPGGRDGNIHYHEPNNTKWLYDLESGQFVDPKTGDLAPSRIQKMLNDPWVQRAIEKAMRYLGV